MSADDMSLSIDDILRYELGLPEDEVEEIKRILTEEF